MTDCVLHLSMYSRVNGSSNIFIYMILISFITGLCDFRNDCMEVAIL